MNGVKGLEELIPLLTLVANRAQVMVQDMVDELKPLWEVRPSSRNVGRILTATHGADDGLRDFTWDVIDKIYHQNI